VILEVLQEVVPTGVQTPEGTGLEISSSFKIPLRKTDSFKYESDISGNILKYSIHKTDCPSLITC
jgi:hypothetical protein